MRPHRPKLRSNRAELIGPQLRDSLNAVATEQRDKLSHFSGFE
jgi:hypothetical protein